MAINLTQKHFQWLAKQIAPLIQNGKLSDFQELVENFCQNRKFDPDLFRKISEEHWSTQQMIEAEEQRLDAEHLYLDETKNYIGE